MSNPCPKTVLAFAYYHYMELKAGSLPADGASINSYIFMDINLKITYFDYFVSCLMAHNAPSEVTKFEDRVRTQFAKGRSISKLKAFKLLFFTVAIDNKEWTLLDEVFDNFYALPYGPVESDIYDNLDMLQNYQLQGNNLTLKTTVDFSYSNCESHYKTLIKSSVDKLGESYPQLLSMSAIELVELSHKSDCWQIAISQATAIGSSSRKMNSSLIKQSRIYFY